MKVSGIGGTAGPAGTRKSGKTEKGAAGAFAKQLSALDSSEETSAPEGTIAVSGIDALLATQEVDDSLEHEQRRRLVDYGESLLDRLDEIRHGLLLGSIPRQRLVGLAHQLRERREKAADPRLAALLDEIELRVEVELAKLFRDA